MASNTFFPLTFLLFLIFATSFNHLTNASFVLPIIKDNNKPQYFTSFLAGTPASNRVYVAIDLGNQFSWFTCDLYNYTSTTKRPVPCDSRKCAFYGGSGCSDFGCGAVAYSPESHALYSESLQEDVITLYKKAPKLAQMVKVPLNNFPFTCAGVGPLKGLSSYTKGIVTLARVPVAIHAQISSTLKSPPKFALCLPASSQSISGTNGAMYFGGGPYNLPSTSHTDLSKSLVTTPLVINPNSTSPIYSLGDASVEYFINVRSIKVDGTPVHFKNSLLIFDKDGVGGTKLSTMSPYTTLQSDIYKALVNEFVTKATTMKMTRVPAVAPFGACFSTKGVANGKTGPNVPIIDLIFDDKSPLLHNKNARWRFYGANSMVKVSSNVLCLAFVDGGSKPMTSIVIGGKQMEDTLVEFDLETNKLGFTSSLLRMGTSCSQFKGV